MGWISDAQLFYGGIAVAVAALVLAVLVFFLSKISFMRLFAQLDEEYGKQEKKKQGRVK